MKNGENPVFKKATIRRDIILEVGEYGKEDPDVKLNADDYSKFTQEAMKYVERRF